MNIAPTQNKRLHLLLNETGNTHHKAIIVLGFTDGRTTHSSLMTQQEAFAMIDHLVSLLPDKTNDPCDKMRKKIISMSYEMGWAKPGKWKTAVLAIDAFCAGEHGKFKKKLNAHTYDELVQLVTQFTLLYKKHISTF